MSRSQQIFELTNDERIIKLFHDTLDEEKRAAMRKMALLEEALKDAMRRAQHAESELSGRLTEKEMRSLRLECIKISGSWLISVTHEHLNIRAVADEILEYVLQVETAKPSEPEMTLGTGPIPTFG